MNEGAAAAAGAAGATAAPGTATCGARLRGGGPCPRPPAVGKRRCRRHGGVANWGAPAGNRNALKHSAFTAAAITRRRAISAFLRDCWRTMREIERGGE
jgi:glucans biosynthesis protein